MLRRNLFLFIPILIIGLGNFVCVEALTVHADTREGIAKKVSCITIPKSGTHLLLKCLAFMGVPYKYDRELPQEKWYKKDRPLNLLPPPNHFKGYGHPYVDGQMPGGLTYFSSDGKVQYSTTNFVKHKNPLYIYSHFAYTPEFDNYLNKLKCRKFLMIRDPRAMVVSFANMVKHGFVPGESTDFELLLLDLIDGRRKNYIPWAVSRHHSYPTIWDMGICQYYRTYLPFIGTDNCLMVRFEDLVGKKGGGSDIKQFETINKIAKHLNISVDNTKILEITQNLFGGSTTFNSGQIDGWKKYFTPQVKKAFKAVSGANKLLIDLGYEKNSNW